MLVFKVTYCSHLNDHNFPGKDLHDQYVSGKTRRILVTRKISLPKISALLTSEIPAAAPIFRYPFEYI
jgi:hypothetical protein